MDQTSEEKMLSEIMDILSEYEESRKMIEKIIKQYQEQDERLFKITLSKLVKIANQDTNEA